MKVLFIHGLEGGPSGSKARALKNEPGWDVIVPVMSCPWNIWGSFLIQRRAVVTFRPDVLVASSYGTIIVLILIQLGEWNGPVVLLSTAMGIVAPHRLWIPENMIGPVVIVHGKMDRICSVNDSVSLLRNAPTCVSLILIDDYHGLRLLTDPEFRKDDNPRLPDLVRKVYASDLTTKTDHKVQNNGFLKLFSLMIQLTFIIISSMFLYIFNWLRSIPE